MKTIWQDLRYGFRMLVKSPGFTLVAVVTLALGIGANSAIFSGVSAFVLRPLPVEEPERVVRVFESSGGMGDHGPELAGSFSFPDYADYRDQAQVFDGLTAQRLVQAALSRDAENDVIWGEMVSGNFFDALRIRPALGRAILPEEDTTPGAHPVVVISQNLWRNRFDANPNIINQNVSLNGQPFTIIGVAPKGFTGSKFALAMDFWVPLSMQQQIDREDLWLDKRGDHRLEVFGRLRDGVTLEQAASSLSVVAQRLGETYPNERNRNTKVVVMPETEGRYEEVSGVVNLGAGLALAVVGVVLLIACANVANLLLVRAAARRKEIGIRLALGASRARIIRQLLTESVLLSLLAGSLGLLLAFWATDLMQAFVPVVPYSIALDFTPDKQALVFTLLVSVLTGIVFGLAPAWQASRPDLVPVLKNETVALKGGSRRLTLRNLLVVVQVALSLMVLVCGGLLIKSFLNAQAIDPGFKTENGLAVALNPGLLGYTEAQGETFYRQLIERVRALPGVQSASVAEYLPLGDSSSSTGPVMFEGQDPPAPGEGLSVHYNTIGAKHFETMQTPLLQGRDFNEGERRDSPPVVIINEALAGRLWPGQSAVGKRLRIADGDFREVIGVAKTGRYRSLGESPRPFLYFSQSQRYQSRMLLLVRAASGASEGIINSVRQEVRALDAKMPVYGVKTFKEHMTFALWGTQMAATLALAFGLLALVLAAIGLYSVMAYTVSQRTHEIGIRMALGAQRGDVLKLVAWQGITLALIGVAVGLAGAFVVTRVLTSILYGVSATDAVTFVGIPALLFAVALLACYLPARRATKVDPMTALRYE
ncbi:MAG: ABC transporter permease [Pyrinomonadaceae bacterium]|nr:ABC transporter permease [Pyrinomonadaceae bacterium]